MLGVEKNKAMLGAWETTDACEVEPYNHKCALGKDKGLAILDTRNDVVIVREVVDYHTTLAFTKLGIVGGDKCGM